MLPSSPAIKPPSAPPPTKPPAGAGMDEDTKRVLEAFFDGTYDAINGVKRELAELREVHMAMHVAHQEQMGAVISQLLWMQQQQQQPTLGGQSFGRPTALVPFNSGPSREPFRIEYGGSTPVRRELPPDAMHTLHHDAYASPNRTSPGGAADRDRAPFSMATYLSTRNRSPAENDVSWRRGVLLNRLGAAREMNDSTH